MKRLLIASAVLAALAFSGASFGQGYVGGSVGQSKFDVDCETDFTCDKTDTGYKVFGGYMFSPNFGVEGAWVDLGKAKQSGSTTVVGEFEVPVSVTLSGTLKASGPALYAVGVYPAGNFAVFGKLGMASIKAKLEVCVDVTPPVLSSGCESDSKTTTDVAWGLGASYQFTKHLGARLEFERFRAQIPDLDKFDIDLVSVGIQYRF